MPTVSVIIPTYQRSHLVTEAIDSVLAQTYRDYEIIVIDDGSTDDTRERLAELGDKIIYLYQSNQSASAARNNGIKAASGKYIAFLDDDDLWFPEKLAKQVAILEAEPKTALVCTNMLILDSSGKVIGQAKSTQRVMTSWTLFHSNLFVFNSTVLVRKTCLDEVGLFDESIKTCEDYDLWLRIAEKHSIRYLDEALISYRNCPGTIHRQRNTIKLRINWIRVKEKALNRNPTLRRLPIGYLDESYYQGYLILARAYFDRQLPEEAAATLSRYRQLRGYNLDLEALSSCKNLIDISPPITINFQQQFLLVDIPETVEFRLINTLFPETKKVRERKYYLPQDYTAEVWSNFFTFCFIENPWQRMVNLYNDWYNQNPGTQTSFSEFCHNFPQQYPEDFHQIKRQIDFVYRNGDRVDFIGKVENLEQDLNFICDRLNISRGKFPQDLLADKPEKHYNSYYDRATKDLVADYFAEDIKLGNYQF